MVHRGDEYVSREKKATQWYRFLKLILRRNLGGDKSSFLRHNSLSLPTKELPNGLGGWMSLLGDSIINLVSDNTAESHTYLLEEDTSHKPSDDRKSRGHGTRKEVGVFLQEFAVTKQMGEPFRRTRECATNDGSTRSKFNGLEQANETSPDSP